MSSKFLSKKAALAAVFAGLTVAAVESSQAMPQGPQSEGKQSILSTALTGITLPADLTIKPSLNSLPSWLGTPVTPENIGLVDARFLRALHPAYWWGHQPQS